MKIETIPVGLIRTNCYIAFDPQTREAIIVDPGDTAAKILGFIEKNGLHVTHILLTHSHFDHILALADVQAATGALVCVHELEAGCVETPDHTETRSLRMPDIYIKPAKADIRLKDGDRLALAGGEFTVLHTPGHTRGSVCYDNGEVIFSGDTLFKDDCGRTDLPGGSFADMQASLRRLYGLPGDRIVYPGHDVSTTLARERTANTDMLRAVRAV